jgi:hypothetical protein
MKIEDFKMPLKAAKQYSTWETSNWYCFYNRLSGDELKTQILSLFYRPTGNVKSWCFSDLSSSYKENEELGVAQWINSKYGDMPQEDIQECVEYICQFLDDAKIEYTGRPFRTVAVK